MILGHVFVWRCFFFIQRILLLLTFSALHCLLLLFLFCYAAWTIPPLVLYFHIVIWNLLHDQ